MTPPRYSASSVRAWRQRLCPQARGKGPKSWETIDSWLSVVTAHAISHYFRKEAVDKKWLNRDAEVEEQPADPPEDLYGEDSWMI